MTRLCDSCKKPIEQDDDEYIEVQVRILKVSENESQNEQDSYYGDYCDGYIENGSAIRTLLDAVGWSLSKKEESDESRADSNV